MQAASLAENDRGLAAGDRAPSLRAAQACCRRLARRHYENFVVASLLLPRSLRNDFYSLYAYCRGADDLADESATPAMALAGLDAWEAELEACYQGQPRRWQFVALAETIRRHALPRAPFLDLLWAFRQDQRVTRYPSHDEVLAYCRGSANPVGRLILHLAGTADRQSIELSDLVCTGLQLANFCQDVPGDFARGRIYLPQDACRRFGVDEAMFAEGACCPSLRRLLAHEVARAEGYLVGGRALAARVPRWLAVDVDLFVRGGLAVLAAIRRADYDVWSRRPRVGRLERIRQLAGAAWGRVAPRPLRTGQ